MSRSWRAAVVGDPIGHSLSPLLHRAAYAVLGVDLAYDAIQVPTGSLKAFVESSDESLIGLSVTMPLKEEARALCQVTDDWARQTGAVNTLVRRQGEWHGHNTDVIGLRELIARFEPSSCVVLGAGATARSALVALQSLGIEEVRVVARRPESEAEIARVLGRRYEFAVLGAAPVRGSLVVNTLPGGVEAQLELVEGRGVWLDLAYSPWPTALAAAAEFAGWQVLSGLELLVNQAVEQVLLFTGVEQSARPAIRQAMLVALAGVPGAPTN